MNSLHQEQSSKIVNLVREIEKLNDVERLLLYLQLPCGRAELPEGKYKNNSLGCSSGPQKQSTDIFSKKSDQETTKTYTWILSHLEEDPNVSLPKQEVYDEYRAFCQANRFEPLCVADFGKAMKHALPCIKPRRLGQRGNSRYCYSGLRKKYKLEPPSLPNILQSCDLQSPATTCSSVTTEHHYPNTHNGNSRRAKSVGLSPSLQFECSTLSCSSNSINRARATTCNKVMNLKIEPCTSTQSCVVSSGSLPDCCSGLSSAQSIVSCSSTTQPHQQQVGTEQQYQQQQQQQQQQHSMPTSPVSTGTPQYSAQPFTQRYGTPDDDDYRHNYHDLNRPIVNQAPIIPFSQSIHAQLAQQPAQNSCFISYDNPQAQAPPPPAPIEHLHHHHSSSSNNSSSSGSNNNHHHQPNQNSHEPIDKQLSTNEQQQHPHQTGIANACCREVNKAAAANGNNNDVNTLNANAQCSNAGANTHRHHHQQADFNDHIRQHVAVSNHQQHQAALQADNSHLHLNLNFLDHSVCSNMEFCASPFQSPASTPYPNLTNYTATTAAQDTQDYFSNDCSIQYSDH